MDWMCVCVCLPDMQSRLGFWFAQCGSPLFISRRKDFLLALTSTKTNIDLSLQAVHRILPVAMVAYPTVWDSSHIMVWKLEPTFLSPGGIHHTYWMYQGQDSLVVRVFDFQQKDSLPLPQWCHIFQDPNKNAYKMFFWHTLFFYLKSPLCLRKCKELGSGEVWPIRGNFSGPWTSGALSDPVLGTEP